MPLNGFRGRGGERKCGGEWSKGLKRKNFEDKMSAIVEGWIRVKTWGFIEVLSIAGFYRFTVLFFFPTKNQVIIVYSYVA